SPYGADPLRSRRDILAVSWVASIVTGLLAAAPAARSQSINTKLWCTDGSVRAIARSGDTLIVGGEFRHVFPVSGGGVVVDGAQGLPYPRSTPRFDLEIAEGGGIVQAVVPDGVGGWFVGGQFTAVSGQPFRNLVHILPDGSLAHWNPQVKGVSVLALALSGGT